MHEAFVCAGALGDGLDCQSRAAPGAVVGGIGHGAGDIDERPQRQP
ncbi:MAG: hypothetical protein LLG14_21600 [Nocardiaceae bacterium]|nr:hypothetical protein [Nocardiaceae bacterium]